MAYKNQKKNKAHIAELKKTGWRAGNRKEKQKTKRRNAVRELGVPELEAMMRQRGLI